MENGREDEAGRPPEEWAENDRQERQQRRRAERRREIMRRRIVAVGSIALVGVAVIVVLASRGGGDRGSPNTRIAHKQAKRKPRPKGPTKVRNATPQSGWEPHTGPVPILEYHDLGAPPEEARYPELFVGRTDFSRQMDWLDEHGWQAVTLEQVEAAWFEAGTLPPKPIVLSFDDGYRPQFTFALPELRKHGWAGVLNLKAEGSDLYESNVKAMIAAGWELAAHTIHHLDLTELGPEELTEETAGAREILQDEFGAPVDDFCYPSGQFDETVVAAVEAAGYTGATTEISGYAESDAPFELARFEILRESGVQGMAEDLSDGEGETAELGA